MIKDFIESTLAESFEKTIKNLQKEGLFENIKSFDLDFTGKGINIKLNESSLSKHGIEIVWINWYRTDDGNYEYEIKQKMDMNRITNQPFTSLKDAMDFAKIYFGKNYDLEIWINNEPKMKKPRGKLTFYNINDTFHVPISTKNNFVKQITSTLKNI